MFSSIKSMIKKIDNKNAIKTLLTGTFLNPIIILLEY